MSARVGYVFKKESNIYKLVNIARPSAATTFRSRPSIRVRTAASAPSDDGGTLPISITIRPIAGPQFETSTPLNLPGYSNRYDNIEIGLDKRLSQSLAGADVVPGDQERRVDRRRAARRPAQNPNENFFPKNQTWDKTFRAAGSYQAPWGILGSAHVRVPERRRRRRATCCSAPGCGN